MYFGNSFSSNFFVINLYKHHTLLKHWVIEKVDSRLNVMADDTMIGDLIHVSLHLNEPQKFKIRSRL